MENITSVLRGEGCEERGLPHLCPKPTEEEDQNVEAFACFVKERFCRTNPRVIYTLMCTG